MSTFNNPYHPEISERSVVGISKIQTFYPKNSKFIPKENEKENAECIDIAISDVFFFYVDSITAPSTLISRLTTRDRLISVFYDSVLPDIASRDPEEGPRIDPSPIFNIIEFHRASTILF